MHKIESIHARMRKYKNDTCLEACVHEIERHGRALSIDHELKSQAHTMTTKYCKNSWCKMAMVSVVLVAVLAFIHFANISFKAWKTPNKREGRHENVFNFCRYISNNLVLNLHRT
jgi:hypothetical protein